MDIFISNKNLYSQQLSISWTGIMPGSSVLKAASANAGSGRPSRSASEVHGACTVTIGRTSCHMGRSPGESIRQ